MTENYIRQDGTNATQSIRGDTPRVTFDGSEAGGTTVSYGERKGRHAAWDATGDLSWVQKPFCTLSLLPSPLRDLDATVADGVTYSPITVSIPTALEESAERIYVEAAREMDTSIADYEDSEIHHELWDVAAGDVAGRSSRRPTFIPDERYINYETSQYYVRSHNIKYMIGDETDYRARMKVSREVATAGATYDWLFSRLVFY